MTLAIDFFTASQSATDTVERDEAPVVQTPAARPSNRSAPSPLPDDHGDSAQDAVNDVVEFLMPKPAEEEDAAPPVVEKKTPAAPKSEAKPDVRQNAPVHPPQLLQLAESWGITSDMALQYPSQEALLGAVAIRELRYKKAVEARDGGGKGKEQEASKPADDDIAPPDFSFDEDDDPKIKSAVESSTAYARKIKERSDKELALMRQELEELKADRQQAADREARSQEAKIAARFDETVASWGDEFADVLGVPTQSWKATGTPQHAEVMKLRNYVMRSRLGYEQMTGEAPSVEVIAGFIEEARGALWPDVTKKAARREIANKARSQKGGVGMRVGSTGADDKPAQGDVAARRGISDFLSGIGMDPWGTTR